MRRERMGFVLLIISLLFVSSSFAGMTRINNLGFMSDMYVLDSYNIWTFPSTIVLFPKMATIESMSGDELNSGGIHMPLSPNVVGGAYLKNSEEEVYFADPTTIDPSTGEPMSRWAAHQADIFMGYNGKTYGLGMHISYFNSDTLTNYVDNTLQSDENFGQSFVGLDFGVSVFSNTRSQLDATLHIGIASFTNDPITTYKGKGNVSIAFAVRYFAAISPTTAIVPFGKLSFERAGYEVTLNNTTSSLVGKLDTYIVGLSSNYVPNERVLVTMAIGYYYSSLSADDGTGNDSGSSSNSALPFLNLGFECKPYSWLSARFGISELLTHWKTDAPNLFEGKSTDHTYVPNFGLSFYLKRFTIDVLVNDTFLHNGPYLMSGHNYGSLFSELSIIYAIP